MSKWFYRIDAREHGPVPDLGLAALLAEGTLKPNDEVRPEGEAEWRPASVALSFHSASDSWSAADLDSMLVSETSTVVAPPRKRAADETDFEVSDVRPVDDAEIPSTLDLDSMLAPSAAAVAAKPA